MTFAASASYPQEIRAPLLPLSSSKIIADKNGFAPHPTRPSRWLPAFERDLPMFLCSRGPRVASGEP